MNFFSFFLAFFVLLLFSFQTHCPDSDSVSQKTGQAGGGSVLCLELYGRWSVCPLKDNKQREKPSSRCLGRGGTPRGRSWHHTHIHYLEIIKGFITRSCVAGLTLFYTRGAPVPRPVGFLSHSTCPSFQTCLTPVPNSGSAAIQRKHFLLSQVNF